MGNACRKRTDSEALLPNPIPAKRCSVNYDDDIRGERKFQQRSNFDHLLPPPPPDGVRSRLGTLTKRRFSTLAAADIAQQPVPPPPSKRHMRVLELLETERNYVAILDTMLDIIRQIPLDTDHPNSIFLEEPDFVDEINTTFSQLPDLLRTHRCIVADLEAVTANWTENASIGAIFTKYGPDLEAYVPFVNSFEKIKVFLLEWEAKCKRFHAYLKFRQTQPGSGRQHLHDLLIRPIQRVPSVVSLLRDIKNKTDDSNPDSVELEKAIVEVQRVLSFINEQKREAEILELIAEIERRPENPRTGYRSYICHLECVELEDDQFDEREAVLIMLLFQDVLEICRRRNVTSKRLSQLHAPKRWEHVDFIPLNRISELVDVPTVPQCQHAFAMSLLTVDDEDCRFKFAATGEFQPQKSAFLRQVAAQISAGNTFSGSATVLRRIASEELRIRTTGEESSRLKRSVAQTLRRLVTRPTANLAKQLRRIVFPESEFYQADQSSFSSQDRRSAERKRLTSFGRRQASILC
ncbi:Protein ECT2 [Hypsibius exemplaris]|uniref:Protein ECT2 n=1 Tax=Hypsibius exemplaris TaxID=2072580 RepID=A0A9X6NF60_HYPEX|nr:Protein ECT2 [Hypsibius exemplaris]